MSDASEHYDNECYYPDDLSGTSSKANLLRKRKKQIKTPHRCKVEVHNFIRSQQQANTVKKQCMT